MWRSSSSSRSLIALLAIAPAAVVQPYTFGRWRGLPTVSHRHCGRAPLRVFGASDGDATTAAAAAADNDDDDDDKDHDVAALKEELNVLQTSIQKLREPSPQRALDSISTAAAKVDAASEESWGRYTKLMDSELTASLLQLYGSLVGFISKLVAGMSTDMGEGYTSALDVLGNPEAAEETRRFWKQSAEAASNQREGALVDAFVRETYRLFVLADAKKQEANGSGGWVYEEESAAEGSALVAARRLRSVIDASAARVDAAGRRALANREAAEEAAAKVSGGRGGASGSEGGAAKLAAGGGPIADFAYGALRIWRDALDEEEAKQQAEQQGGGGSGGGGAGGLVAAGAAAAAP